MITLGSIKSSPEDAALYRWRGDIYAHSGKYDKALPDLKKAIEIEPTNSNYYLNYALILAQASKYDETIENYTKGI